MTEDHWRIALTLLVLVAGPVGVGGVVVAEADVICWRTGGRFVVAEEVPEENATSFTGVPFESLEESQRSAVEPAIEAGSAMEPYPIPDLPDSVRYDGAVYEISVGGYWDGRKCL